MSLAIPSSSASRRFACDLISSCECVGELASAGGVGCCAGTITSIDSTCSEASIESERLSCGEGNRRSSGGHVGRLDEGSVGGVITATSSFGVGIVVS